MIPVMNLIKLLKGVWAVFISKIKTLFGLEPITFIGLIMLLTLDLIADFYHTPNTERIKQYVMNIFFYLGILFVLNSFTFQLSLIFMPIYNSVLIIIILDNLFNLLKTLGNITKESTFSELKNYLKDILINYINKAKPKEEIKPEEKKNETGTDTVG